MQGSGWKLITLRLTTQQQESRSKGFQVQWITNLAGSHQWNESLIKFTVKQ